MTQSHEIETEAARFRKELLFVCCKSDDPTKDQVRQLHDVLLSPTDKMLSPVTRALRAKSFQGNNRMSA
ncbi:hypothetical protein DVH05_010852 [Phytophthora capsici]|nr:hypothetical protein DVH05_006464 [Phytophthora capsici]KAG1701551.1 hypothetical protein DVH05_010852 [Phytophthora capsici]